MLIIFFLTNILFPYRKKDNNKYQGTTWQINFKLDNVDKSGNYKLRLALASATLSELQVYINLC